MSIKKTVVAKSKGEVVGEKECDWPENLKEAIQMHGEEKVFSLFSQQLKVQVAASLRPAVASAGSISKKSVYEKMVAAGVDANTATAISGYTPE